MPLGFIIFGWPKRTKEYGPTVPDHCDNCDNSAYFFLFKERRWFSLFFIPLIPLGFATRYLLCSVCQAGYEIEKSEWKHLKGFTKRTKAYESGELSEETYRQEFDELCTELWGERDSELEPGDKTESAE